MCFAEEILDAANASLNEEADTNLDEQEKSITEEENETSRHVGAATFANFLG